MANKLKDIFTKKPLERKIRFEFNDEEGYRQFLKGLEKVGSEGCPVEVGGVKSIHTISGNGSVIYADDCDKDIVKSVITPSSEPIPIKLNTEFGTEEIVLERIIINDGFLIMASIGNVIQFKLKSNISKNETNISYTVEQKNASDVKHLVRSMATAFAFCKYLFKSEDELKTVKSDSVNEQIKNIKDILDYFANALRIFKHLDYLNDKFNLTISPSKFDECNNFNDVEELYYSLKGMPIRSDENFTSLKTDIKDLKVNNVNELVGQDVNLTFPNYVTYSILGEEITLYSANLLCNAVITSIEKIDDNFKAILEPEKDKSMYVVYTAYETPEEVNRGLKEIREKREVYFNAPTISQFIAEKYKEGIVDD